MSRSSSSSGCWPCINITAGEKHWLATLPNTSLPWRSAMGMGVGSHEVGQVGMRHKGHSCLSTRERQRLQETGSHWEELRLVKKKMRRYEKKLRWQQLHPPTLNPTVPVTSRPSKSPTDAPTRNALLDARSFFTVVSSTSAHPSASPTANPTHAPTDAPTNTPTLAPSRSLQFRAARMFFDHTSASSFAPTTSPTGAPTVQSHSPTHAPTPQPTAPPTPSGAMEGVLAFFGNSNSDFAASQSEPFRTKYDASASTAVDKIDRARAYTGNRPCMHQHFSSLQDAARSGQTTATAMSTGSWSPCNIICGAGHQFRQSIVYHYECSAGTVTSVRRAKETQKRPCMTGGCDRTGGNALKRHVDIPQCC
jgi:hypothetical protein